MSLSPGTVFPSSDVIRLTIEGGCVYALVGQDALLDPKRAEAQASRYAVLFVKNGKLQPSAGRAVLVDGTVLENHGTYLVKGGALSAESVATITQVDGRSPVPPGFEKCGQRWYQATTFAAQPGQSG